MLKYHMDCRSPSRSENNEVELDVFFIISQKGLYVNQPNVKLLAENKPRF